METREPGGQDRESDQLREQQLRAQAERLRIVQDDAPVGICETDLDGRLLRVNDRFCRITGYPREELLTRRFHDFCHPADVERSADHYRRLLSGAIASYTIEKRSIHKDGRSVWIELNESLLRDADGTPQFGIGVIQDISARKHAEALQAGQTEVLEAIAQGAPLCAALDLLAQTIEAQSSSGVMVSILLLDRDGQHLRHAAGPSLSDAYNDAIDGIDVGPDVGSCGRAAYTRQPAYTPDIENDPSWIAFLDLARKHGLRACWSTPILAREGQVLGTFAMYYREPREPNAEDLRLVDLATRTAAIAIERKRTEEQLLDTRASLQSALDAGAIATWTWDLRQNCIKGDSNLANFFSVPGAESEGAPPETYMRAIHPDDLAHVSKQIDAALAGGDTYEADYRVVKPEGGVRWVTARGRVERDTQGKAVRLLGVVADISARKAAEDAMRESKERLDFALEVAALGQWDLNLIEHTAYRTLWHDQIFGYSTLLPEWSYETFLAHVLPEDRAAVDASFQRALTGEAGWNIECRIRRADGEARWIWVNGRIQRNTNGAVVRMLGTVLDITERKRAEAGVLESETRYRLVADASNDAIWDWNLVTNEVIWNEGVRTVFDYDAEDVAPTANWRYEHIHPDDRERVVNGIHRAIDSGKKAGATNTATCARMARRSTSAIAAGSCTTIPVKPAAWSARCRI